MLIPFVVISKLFQLKWVKMVEIFNFLSVFISSINFTWV